MIEKAFKVHSDLVQYCSSSKDADIAIAQKLYVLRKFDLWRNAVGGIDTWEDYLKQPEVNIPKSKANKLIKIYEYFGIENRGWDTNDVPLYVLEMIAKHNPKSTVISEMLECGKTLSRSDFKERFHDLTKGINGEEANRTYSYIIMKKCNETGTLKKEHGVPSELIKETFNLD